MFATSRSRFIDRKRRANSAKRTRDSSAVLQLIGEAQKSPIYLGFSMVFREGPFAAINALVAHDETRGEKVTCETNIRSSNRHGSWQQGHRDIQF